MPVPQGAKVGKISKPYGLRGDVSVILEEGTGHQIEPGDPLFISMDGQRVPFFIEETEEAGKGQLIIKFEFIEGVEDARKICGCDVFLDPVSHPAAEEANFSLESMVGWVAIDRVLGTLGTLTGYMDHEYNPVFQIMYGDREILVPAREEFIEQIDPDRRTITFQLPEGITDL